MKESRFPSWPLCHSGRRKKKIPPVFRSDKTSAPPLLTKSRARKWDYGECPLAGTCSIVIPSSTGIKGLCRKTKLLSPLRSPPPPPPAALPSASPPSLPPTFLSAFLPRDPSFLRPPFLLPILLSLTSSQTPSPVPSLPPCWLLRWLSLSGRQALLHLPFAETAVLPFEVLPGSQMPPGRVVLPPHLFIKTNAFGI